MVFILNPATWRIPTTTPTRRDTIPIGVTIVGAVARAFA
jgi:hypothetical protein